MSLPDPIELPNPIVVSLPTEPWNQPWVSALGSFLGTVLAVALGAWLAHRFVIRQEIRSRKLELLTRVLMFQLTAHMGDHYEAPKDFLYTAISEAKLLGCGVPLLTALHFYEIACTEISTAGLEKRLSELHATPVAFDNATSVERFRLWTVGQLQAEAHRELWGHRFDGLDQQVVQRARDLTKPSTPTPRGEAHQPSPPASP